MNIGNNQEPPTIADKYKHCQVECLAQHVPDVRLLIEWHSGAGITDSVKDGVTSRYEGSAVRAMRILTQRGMPLESYLTEIKEDRRAALVKNTAQFANVTINKDWREELRRYVGYANERSMTIIDPDKGTDYLEDNLLLYTIPVIFSGSHCLFHMAEHPRLSYHRDVLRKMADAISHAGRTGTDLYHPEVSDDLELIHHNIVVSDPDVVRACEQGHLAMLEKDPHHKRFPYDGGIGHICPDGD